MLGCGWAAHAQEDRSGLPEGQKIGIQRQDSLQREETALFPEEDELAEDEFVRVKDTTDYPLFTEAQAFVDYGKLLMLPFGFERKFEGGGQILLENRYLLSLSYGHGSIWPQNAYKNVNYMSSGSYIKPGIYYQMTINPGNKLAAGAQFGIARFADEGRTVIQSGSGLFEPYERSFARSSLSASWWELAVQSETKWRGNFWLGFRLSLRKLIDFNNPGNPDVFVVPGYGRTNSRSMPAVNLFIKYKLSFFRPTDPAANIEPLD